MLHVSAMRVRGAPRHLPQLCNSYERVWLTPRAQSENRKSWATANYHCFSMWFLWFSCFGETNGISRYCQPWLRLSNEAGGIKQQQTNQKHSMFSLNIGHLPRNINESYNFRFNQIGGSNGNNKLIVLRQIHIRYFWS